MQSRHVIITFMNLIFFYFGNLKELLSQDKKIKDYYHKDFLFWNLWQNNDLYQKLNLWVLEIILPTRIERKNIKNTFKIYLRLK